MYRHIDVPGYGAPFWTGLGEEVDMSGETRPDVVRTGLGEPPELGEVLDQDSDLLPIVQAGARSRGFRGDRKSVGEGKSVSVRVDHGGRRLFKKKKKYTLTNTTHR